MKRLLMYLILFAFPLMPASAQSEPPPAADLPPVDTNRQIEMWGYGHLIATAWSHSQLAVATRAGIRLYDPENPDDEPVFLPPQSGAYTDLAFNDSRLFATDSLGGVWSWDIPTGQVSLFAAVEGSVSGLQFSADGKTVFARTEDWLYVWDTATRQRQHVISIASELLYDSALVAISIDGTHVAVSDFKKPVQIWDLSGTEPVLTEWAQPKPKQRLTPLAFSIDNTRLFGAQKTGLSVWSKDGQELAHIKDKAYHQASADHTFMLDDGRLMIFNSVNPPGTRISLWSPDLSQPPQTITFDRYFHWYGLSLSPDQRRIAALPFLIPDSTWKLMLIDMHSFEITYESQPLPQTGYIVGSDVSLITNPLPGELNVRDIVSGEITDTLHYKGGDVWSMALSPNGQRIAICTSLPTPMFEPIIYVRNLNQPGAFVELYTSSGADIHLSCGRMVYDEQRRDFLTNSMTPAGLYAIRDAAQLLPLPESLWRPDDLILSGDTLWMVSVEAGVYKANIRTGEVQQIIEPRGNSQNHPFRPITDLYENHLAYVGGVDGKTVYIYDTAAETDIYAIDTASTVTALTFSPDGRLIITGHLDGYILKWDAETGAFLGQIGRIPDGVNALILTPDATRLYSTGYDSVGRVWSLE